MCRYVFSVYFKDVDVLLLLLFQASVPDWEEDEVKDTESKSHYKVNKIKDTESKSNFKVNEIKDTESKFNFKVNKVKDTESKSR